MTQLSANDYLSQAQKALDDCSPELCLNITETALKIYSEHSGLTVMKGVALLDLLNLSQSEKEAMQYFQASKNAFLKAIDLDANHVESFLYLGQLTTDRESIDWYSKAFGLLESQLNQLTNEQEVHDLQFIHVENCIKKENGSSTLFVY
jgi:hypothetical protein